MYLFYDITMNLQNYDLINKTHTHKNYPSMYTNRIELPSNVNRFLINYLASINHSKPSSPSLICLNFFSFHLNLENLSKLL